MCPAPCPMHVVQRRDVPATSPRPPGAAALLPGKDGLSHTRVLCSTLSPLPTQDCHQSTPPHCIPSPWHVVQQLMPLSASPAIHKTWMCHGMAQDYYPALACGRLQAGVTAWWPL